MKPSLAITMLGALLVVSGCGSMSQLETMKKGDLAKNAVASIDCSASQAECYQLHLLKGDACYGLSVRDDSTASKRNHASCAASELDAGMKMAPSEQTAVGTKQDYARKRLDALHQLIDTRGAGDPSGADALASAADEFRQHYPTDAAGPYYLASARLTSAQDAFLRTGDAAALCRALPSIDTLVREGNAAPGDLGAQYTNLAASLTDMKRSGNCS
jgi:hypothetical protein